MITGKCDVCGADIKPAETQAQFNRNMGLHKRSAHGLAGKKYQPKRRQKLDLEAQRKLRRERQARWRNKNRQGQPSEAVSAVQPCNLDHCPKCGARFYISYTEQS